MTNGNGNGQTVSNSVEGARPARRAKVERTRVATRLYKSRLSGDSMIDGISNVFVDFFQYTNLCLLLIFTVLSTVRVGNQQDTILTAMLNSLGLARHVEGANYVLFLTLLVFNFLTANIPASSSLLILFGKFSLVAVAAGYLRQFSLPVYSIIAYTTGIWVSTSSTKLRYSAVIAAFIGITLVKGFGGGVYIDESSSTNPIPEHFDQAAGANILRDMMHRSGLNATTLARMFAQQNPVSNSSSVGGGLPSTDGVL